MVGTSLRRKPKKRSSKNSNPSSASMASHYKAFFHSNLRRVSLLTSALIFASVLIVVSVSSNVISVFGSTRGYDQLLTVEVVREFPHDPTAFTQGLVYAGNDTLFESTGLNGRSSVRKVALRTGKVEAIHKMPNSYFGEGLTLLGDRLFQVNWLTKTGFVYDRNNLTTIKKFTNQMKDGWGLATDGKVIFGSDGTSTLYKIDPLTMEIVQKHTVKYKGLEVPNLNELEFIHNEVWANVWQTDCIARISSKDGVVLGWIYLPHLRKKLIASGSRDIDVLNGIAWDHEKDRIFLTGKLWPKLYEIKLQPMKKTTNLDIERQCVTKPFNF